MKGKEMGRKLKAERQAVRTPCRQSSTASPSRRWAPPGSGTALRERAGCGELPQSYKKRRKKPFLTPHPDGNKDGKQPPEPRGREKPPSRRTTKPHKGLRAGLLSPPPPSLTAPPVNFPAPAPRSPGLRLVQTLVRDGHDLL